MQSAATAITPAVKRRPGRPPTYVFDRPDDELTENERRLRSAVLKRRERQNRSYRRRKLLKSQQLAKAHQAAAAAYIPPVPVPPPVPQGNSQQMLQHRSPSHSHSPQLPALVRQYDSIPHPPHPDTSVSAPLRAASLFLPRLQPNAYGTHPSSTPQRLPPTSSSSISNAPPVLPPPHMPPHQPQPHDTRSYESTPTQYGFEMQQQQHQASHSHSLPTHPPPPLHPDNGGIRQDTATITTGTLFSAPTLASKSAEPIPDMCGPLMNGEHNSRDQQSHHIGVTGGWRLNYERATQSSEPNHVHI